MKHVMKYNEINFVASYEDIGKYLLQHPDKEEYQVKDVANQLKLGERPVKGIMNILEDEGYAQQTNGTGDPSLARYKIQLTQEDHEELLNLQTWWAEQI